MRYIEIVQGESFSLRESPSLDYLKSILELKNIRTENVFYENGLIFFPSSLVGTITVPEAEIVITPRHEGISLNHVIRLYNFTYMDYEDSILSTSIFDLEESSNYHKIIDMFIQQLYLIIRKGIDSDFNPRFSSMKNKKGKLDIVRTCVNLHQRKSNPLVCSYTQMGYDTNLNSYLAVALEKIKRLLDFDDYIYLSSRFIRKEKDLNFVRGAIKIGRKNAHYLKAYQLASLIINETFFEKHGSSEEYDSFLINYDKLFEDFIKLVLINRNSDSGFVEWKEDKIYGRYSVNDTKFTKQFRPDLLYNQSTNGKCAAVIDVKNKTSSPFNNQDVYQILFYMNMLDSKKAILIYPASKKQSPLKLRLIKEINQVDTVFAIYVEITANTTDNFLSSLNDFKITLSRIIHY